MDEPNSNLDELGETALVQSVNAIKDNGGTVILTTHRPRLVSIVDKMLVLKAGKQVAFGGAKEMLDSIRKLQVVQTEDATKSSDQDSGVIPIVKAVGEI